MSESLKMRTYGGREDLSALMHFASAALSARFPIHAAWHPGDFAWALKSSYDQVHRVHIWTACSEVVGVSFFESPDKVLLELLPSAQAFLAPILDWAEAKAVSGRSKADTLSVRVMEADFARRNALEALGFVRSGPDHVWFQMDLSGQILDSPKTQGFQVRDSIGLGSEARAAAHRTAWNDLSHMGIDAQSSFSAANVEMLRTAPVYDPRLDLVVADREGRLVASCTAWPDLASGIGVFEPVGTDPKFRGQRLARLVILEGARRLRAQGHRWARVGTAHFNASAIGAYLACGFRPLDRSAWWTKTIG